MELSRPDLFRQQAFLNGHWVEADDGCTLDVVDPATGMRIGSVPSLGLRETRAALEGATAAQAAWAATPVTERAALLRRWFELMQEHREDLARIMTREQGKPLIESRAEINYAAGFAEWFAEEARRAYGEILPPPQADRRMLVIKQPVGVCAAITPWNFPAAMITRKAAPALAAGCTIVVRPASQTPFSAFALAVLAQEAGIPDGVLSVLTGPATVVGHELATSPLVRKLSFTGSTAVGKVLMAEAAGTVKKMSMELGGNAAFIVFEDADLDLAVEGAIAAKFRNTGQACIAANRFLVHDAVYEAFSTRLAKRMQDLVVGNGFQEGVVIGPLINEDAVRKMEAHIANATAAGAQVLVGGHRHALGGNFFAPTLLTGVTPDMRLSCEETFGPIAGLLRFSSEAEAVSLANATPFGLAAYFYSENVRRVMRVGEALEAGMVAVNTGLFSNAVAPFGGIKESGIGREGSRHGLDEYLELKLLVLGGMG